jgi:hypothetical protein
MSHEAAQIALVIDRIARKIMAKIATLSDEQLNQPLPVPDANTLFAIATHAVGMGEFWVLTLVGARPSQRNRSAEFLSGDRRGQSIDRALSTVDCRHSGAAGYATGGGHDTHRRTAL